jgi:hypothetical protein
MVLYTEWVEARMRRPDGYVRIRRRHLVGAGARDGTPAPHPAY